MTTRDTIERALWAHGCLAVEWLATGPMTWRCYCGASGTAQGETGAQDLWRHHATEAIERALGMIAPTPLDPEGPHHTRCGAR